MVKVVLGTEGQEAGTVVLMSLHGLRERKREHRSWDFLGGHRLGTTNHCPGGNSRWLYPLRGGQLLLLSDEDGWCQDTWTAGRTGLWEGNRDPDSISGTINTRSPGLSSTSCVWLSVSCPTVCMKRRMGRLFGEVSPSWNIPEFS